MAVPTRSARSSSPTAPSAMFPAKPVGASPSATSWPVSWSAATSSGPSEPSPPRFFAPASPARWNAAANSRTWPGSRTLNARNNVIPPAGATASRRSTQRGTRSPSKASITRSRMASSVNARSTLDGPGKAAHEVSLDDQEEQQDRDDRQGHARGDAPEVGDELALQRRQPDRKRQPVLGMEHQRGPQEVVPGRDEGEDGDRRQRRTDERQHDRPPDPPLPRPVDAGRVDEVPGHTPEGLAQQEDVEGTDQVGQDQRRQRVVVVEHVDRQHEARDVRQLGGNDQCR